MSKADEIFDFWFGSDSDDAAVIAAKSSLWWSKDPELDGDCRQRFGADVERARCGELDAWAETARGRLALIILIDQLSRNVYRDASGAFSADERALALCVEGLGLGHDRELRLIERMFFYLPLEHSELLENQQRSVDCYKLLYEEVPPELEKMFADYLDYAHRHLQVIERFGRFPHRNAILGRGSTDEEQSFLVEERWTADRNTND